MRSPHPLPGLVTLTATNPANTGGWLSRPRSHLGAAVAWGYLLSPASSVALRGYVQRGRLSALRPCRARARVRP